jgi:hypothetical protein
VSPPRVADPPDAASGRWAHRDLSAFVILVNPHLRYLRNLRMPFVLRYLSNLRMHLSA